ncbi:hypothetical protein MACH24_22170 [Erythrobacter sp. Dej080120_24]|uniref:hypothetical protein n=1 Tax=Erythrobacter sp. Dej080120_24 TaxID=3024837 RepID=UPI002920C568|nr:hypothetical protein MACH24_22170 [Erythrobacter sp. Dej080120_24]
MIESWQAPLQNGTTSEELLVQIDRGRNIRVLILPALFDEANKLRRFTIELMRALDRLEIDSFLPDMPGCNESLVPLSGLSLSALQAAATSAMRSLGATHVLAIRGGALLLPEGAAGWAYAPVSGAKLLRSMIRARTISAREAGRSESSEELQQTGRKDGLTLAGWEIGAEMFREIETAEPPVSGTVTVISQQELGGAGLWLRAEPGEDAAQTEKLAAILASSVGADG